ncbi:MAG TPA: DMT family transporter [Feifaniaceae bacterium]|nr:DMT family transporter [Feifaniaceae bacterium]
MQVTKKQALLAEAALLLAGLIWGSGFVVMKNSLDLLPVNWLLTLRFFIAAAVLCGILWKRVLHVDKRTLAAGAVCGVLLYAGYYVQTLGLNETTAGNNAFLTAIYVVLAPLFHWFISGKKPGSHVFAAAVLCLAGVGLIALQQGMRANAGDLLTLLCGMLFAVHIVAVAHFTEKGVDVFLLTGLQFLFAAVSGAIMGAFLEPFPAPETLFASETVSSLLYLGFGCTLLALLLENIGLKYAPVSSASLLMSTEAPFGFLFGILFLQEPFTIRFLFGALLIAGSIVLSELGHKLKRKKREPAVEEDLAVPAGALPAEQE